jgi:hypothetical protein
MAVGAGPGQFCYGRDGRKMFRSIALLRLIPEMVFRNAIDFVTSATAAVLIIDRLGFRINFLPKVFIHRTDISA